MLRIQNYLQVAVYLAAKTLEVPDLMKDGRWDNKDVFDVHEGKFRRGMALDGFNVITVSAELAGFYEQGPDTINRPKKCVSAAAVLLERLRRHNGQLAEAPANGPLESGGGIR